MHLLVNESPLLLTKSIAKYFGVTAAILLQQLHYRLQHSLKERDGFIWVHFSYEEWQENDFPFLSTDTIKRTFRKLERMDVVITSNHYNRMAIDRTKWTRIDYAVFNDIKKQNALLPREVSTVMRGPKLRSHEGNSPPAITREVTRINKIPIEPKALDS